jgi:hypothetical protein
VGECYAIDLGGTNFRVVYVKLSPNHGGVVRPGALSRQHAGLPSQCCVDLWIHAKHTHHTATISECLHYPIVSAGAPRSTERPHSGRSTIHMCHVILWQSP